MRKIEDITTYNTGIFPNTFGVNSTGPSTKDGTELIANVFNDYIGVLPQALLNEMSITPNGNAETIASNQQMQALIGMMQRYGSAYGIIGSADTDANHDVQLSVGQVPDTTRKYTLRLTAAIAKQGDVAWAAGGIPGTPAGGLMGGSWTASTEYGVYIIYNPTTGVTDAGFSVYTGAGVPTFLPAGFTIYQLVEWVITDGSSNIIPYITREIDGRTIEKHRTTPVLDISLANTLTTARRLDAIGVTTGFEVIASLIVRFIDASGVVAVWIGYPGVTDTAVGGNANDTNYNAYSTGYYPLVKMRIKTNTARQIAARANIITVDSYFASLESFIWRRF
jgi:hypothetical protein